MKGFDQKFKDFPDYILGITKEIWEDRGISTLYNYYGKDMYLRMPLGTSRGNSGVIAKTMETRSTKRHTKVHVFSIVTM